MGLFGKSVCLRSKAKKIHCPFSFSSSTGNKEPTLIELAEERFGDDRGLIMHLMTFLSERRKQRQLPTRLAWSMQLKLLEKFPREERAKQVTKSIMRGYRAIAYESSLSNYQVMTDKEKEENILNVAY